MFLKFSVIVIFAGSVFVTSGKFVDIFNTPKYYFVLLSLLTMGIVQLAVISKQSKYKGVLSNKILLFSIYMVCFLHACYGLCQFLGWIPMNNSQFRITGCFDNPAGFAAVLSIGFPIGLYLHFELKGFTQYWTTAGAALIATTILLSGSRASILSTIISSSIFFVLKHNIISKIKQVRYYKLFYILTIALLITCIFIYYYKKDSANGRLLIWKVSYEMIIDKPFLGHGYGSFNARYMNYQAKYFNDNPDSKFNLLADNVRHPFNEFIKVAVEFGVTSLVLILLIILFILWKIYKSKNEHRVLVFSGLVSFLVFAFFSYPLQYITVWLFLTFYLTISIPLNKILIKNSTISIINSSVIAIACAFSLIYIFKQISVEMKWKTIAVNSLSGNTEEMLEEYQKLYSTSLKQNPFFLYNYGAELNVAGKFDNSIEMLTECKKRFNDYDLQILLADNYFKNGESEKAIQIYQQAAAMIPCRFLPLYLIFEIYKNKDQKDMAMKYANKIVSKKVKIPSITVTLIKTEAEEYLKVNKSTFGNMR